MKPTYCYFCWLWFGLAVSFVRVTLKCTPHSEWTISMELFVNCFTRNLNQSSALDSFRHNVCHNQKRISEIKTNNWEKLKIDRTTDAPHFPIIIFNRNIIKNGPEFAWYAQMSVPSAPEQTECVHSKNERIHAARQWTANPGWNTCCERRSLCRLGTSNTVRCSRQTRSFISLNERPYYLLLRLSPKCKQSIADDSRNEIAHVIERSIGWTTGERK